MITRATIENKLSNMSDIDDYRQLITLIEEAINNRIITSIQDPIFDKMQIRNKLEKNARILMRHFAWMIAEKGHTSD